MPTLTSVCNVTLLSLPLTTSRIATRMLPLSRRTPTVTVTLFPEISEEAHALRGRQSRPGSVPTDLNTEKDRPVCCQEMRVGQAAGKAPTPTTKQKPSA
jgi:hypothetical protein